MAYAMFMPIGEVEKQQCSGVKNFFYKVEKLYVLFCFTILLDITYGQENRTLCKPVTIDCVCRSGENTKNVQLKLEANVTEHLENGEVKCSGYPEPHRACANISCYFVENNVGPVMNENSFISNFYPQVVTFLAGDADGGRRFRRADDPCQVTPLKYANIKCEKWPNWIKCDIKCIHGYALQSGEKFVTSKSINCRRNEDWEPMGFVECQPYLNCNVQLVKPGDLKCKQPLHGPAYCDISCNAFEHYEAIAQQRYECTDESFYRILPHCASLHEMVHLVEKPT